MAYEKELNVALNAVRKAAALCTSVQFRLLTADTMLKKDRSPVTIADYGSQAVMSALLAKSFSADPLIGEEDIDELEKNDDMRAKVLELVQEQIEGMDDHSMLAMIARGNAESGGSRCWTCDPVDGTKGFIRRQQYAVALALLEDGEVKVGVLGCPNLPAKNDDPAAGTGCLFYATKGGGAFMSDLRGSTSRQIHVDDLRDPSRTRFAESVESAHAAISVHRDISTTLGITTAPLQIDGQGKYAVLARGDVSIYLRYPKDDIYREKIWDHAAGAIIVEEAGGLVTDIDGAALNFSGRRMAQNRGIVATNGLVHTKVINVIAQHRERLG
ncbi:3'(2'),5'-bisphosphate nucleotidase [candidate division KSB1 bacterium]|nr:3'(2'),5'-bisphosphate nucleotidase [candidate division KSB1 bacterium]